VGTVTGNTYYCGQKKGGKLYHNNGDFQEDYEKRPSIPQGSAAMQGAKTKRKGRYTALLRRKTHRVRKNPSEEKVEGR